MMIWVWVILVVLSGILIYLIGVSLADFSSSLRYTIKQNKKKKE